MHTIWQVARKAFYCGMYSHSVEYKLKQVAHKAWNQIYCVSIEYATLEYHTDLVEVILCHSFVV